jgi:hypothetical protein
VEVSCQLHALAALPKEKSPLVHAGKEDEWATEPVRSLLKKEKSCPEGNQIRAVQTVASRYTDLQVHFIHITNWIQLPQNNVKQ